MHPLPLTEASNNGSNFWWILLTIAIGLLLALSVRNMIIAWPAMEARERRTDVLSALFWLLVFLAMLAAHIL